MLIKKKRCAFLASVKPEKLNNRMTRRHSGSHAIAWAAHSKTWHCSSTLRGLIKVLVEAEGHKMEDRI